MGILLKDQKVLYASENLGQIDVDEDPIVPTIIPVTGVSVSSPSQALGETVGSTLQLNAVILPNNATNKSVTWSSSNPNLAVVSSTGLVTRIAASTVSGVVVITATANNGVSGSLSLSVPASSVDATITILNPTGNILEAVEGSTVTLTAMVTPSSYSGGIIWSSSDPNVAVVNGSQDVCVVTRTAPLTSDDGQPLSVTITARTVNGVTGSVTIQAAVLQLPAGAFAVFDGIVGARNASANQWQDMSGNEHHMTFEKTDQGVCTLLSSDWKSGGYLECDANNRSISGGVYTSDFIASNGYTMCALIAYDVDASDFHHGESAAGNLLDILFSMKDPNSNKRSQLGIGQRNATDYKNKPFSGINDGNSWELQYVSSAQNLSGVHLLVYRVNGSGTTCEILLDGTQITNFSLTKNMVDVAPNLFFFAADIITETPSNVYNFFGNVYGIAIYNSALSDADIMRVKEYYKARYNNYNA